MIQTVCSLLTSILIESDPHVLFLPVAISDFLHGLEVLEDAKFEWNGYRLNILTPEIQPVINTQLLRRLLQQLERGIENESDRRLDRVHALQLDLYLLLV